MWSGSDAAKDAWLHIADMVTQKYPNIKIHFETTPFNDYWTKLTTEAARGKTRASSACRVSGPRSSATCWCRWTTT
jgi:ABC-type glycerol-3-phosphate transport system substrate-binding protein